MRVDVKISGNGYRVYIEPGILEDAGSFLKKLELGSQVAILSNPVVSGLYLSRLEASLSEEGFECHEVMVPDGEEYKTLESAERIYESLVALKADRSWTLIALGGGVIGDLTGFVAATYMRGLSYVMIPTTLLAQVDASIGGKVGVDHRLGKNLIGCFYQPALVLADPSVLRTLDPRELRSGMAEVVKSAIIASPELFRTVHEMTESILSLDPDILVQVIFHAASIKANVVEEDPLEKEGKRTVLNLGHTIGHALEAATGYRVFKHGEAVSIGMYGASLISQRKGLIRISEVNAIADCLRDIGLPLYFKGVSCQEVHRAMEMDKKRKGRLYFVLPLSIGQVTVTPEFPDEDLLEVLEELSSG